MNTRSSSVHCCFIWTGCFPIPNAILPSASAHPSVLKHGLWFSPRCFDDFPHLHTMKNTTMAGFPKARHGGFFKAPVRRAHHWSDPGSRRPGCHRWPLRGPTHAPLGRCCPGFFYGDPMAVGLFCGHVGRNADDLIGGCKPCLTPEDSGFLTMDCGGECVDPFKRC